MAKLAFEQIDDVRAVHPYLFVYQLRDDQTFQIGEGHPFLQIAVGRDQKVSFNFYCTPDDVSLSLEDWQRILEAGRKFLAETLESGDDW
jgi:hypothetical protein